MKKNFRKLLIAPIALTAIAALAACSGETAPAEQSVWSTATSVEDGGGMDALIEAAQAEGEFNAMGLYEDWANYGGLLDAFSEKYDITINNDVSSGASQELINAVVNRQGQDDTLDYLDTGMSFAADASTDGLLAEYYPATHEDIPADRMSADGTWYNHLGGNMAIACDANAVEVCPTSWADLNDPIYAGMVAINGDPTTGESGFMTVFSAALANGGSLDDIMPGIEYFADLSEQGILLPVTGSAGTIETGETPIYITWDYLLVPIANDLESAGVDLQINHPTDGTVSSYYAASINADAAHPAVARLWFEFLFSDEGQNLLLEGFVKPIRLDAMIEQGTVNQDALDQLPAGTLEEAPQPSLEQRDSQQPILVENWAVEVG